MPDELAAVAPFERQADAFPGRIWIGARAGWVAPAPAQPRAPPRLDVVAEERDGAARIVRARLWSPRGALRFAVRVPRGAELVSIARRAGEPGIEPPRREIVRFTGIDADGLVLAFRVADGAPIDVDLADAAAEMPDGFEVLSRARPAHCVPRGEGDVSVITERVRL
jgi:hypothetical protein